MDNSSKHRELYQTESIVVSLVEGKVKKTTLRGTKDTAYFFNFKSKQHGDVGFMMSHDDGKMLVTIDAQSLKEHEQENLLDGFFWALFQCQDDIPLKRQEEPKEPEEPPQKNVYGYAKKEDQDDLANAFSKMGIGKGRTRRQKRQRATRRRKTNLHNRRR